MKFLLRYIFVFYSLQLFAVNKSTPILEREITIHSDNESIETILASISAQADFTFSYSPNAINNTKKITLHLKNKPVRLALNQIFGNEIELKTKSKYVILSKKTVSKKNSEKTRTIEGYVYDSKTGEKLTETSVYDKTLQTSAVTNEYGYFSMEVPNDIPATDVYVSKIGYSNAIVNSDTLSNKITTIEIESKNETIQKDSNRFVFINLPKLAPIWMIPKEIKANTLNIRDSFLNDFQFSLLPTISNKKLMGGNTISKFSLNATIGLSQGVTVAELGGIMNIDLGNVSYLQIAGVGNIVGEQVTGIQAAGVFNYAKSVSGIQYAGNLNFVKQYADFQISGSGNFANKNFLQVTGVINFSEKSAIQIAGIINVADENTIQVAGICNIAKVSSMQIAGISNISTKNTIQVSGVVNYSKQSEIQVSGITSVSDKSKNAQVSSIVNIANDSCKYQIAGLVNNSKGNAKTQIAVFYNKTRKLDILQIGLINKADTSSGIPIGIFSFVKKGYHKFELATNEIFTANLAFYTGVKVFHTFITSGYTAGNSKLDLWTVGYGVGTSLGKKNSLNIDFCSNPIFDNGNIDFSNHLHKVFIGIDKQFFPKFSIALGLTYNFLITNTSNVNYSTKFSRIAPYTLNKYKPSNGRNYQSWIGAKLAIRVF